MLLQPSLSQAPQRNSRRTADKIQRRRGETDKILLLDRGFKVWMIAISVIGLFEFHSAQSTLTPSILRRARNVVSKKKEISFKYPAYFQYYKSHCSRNLQKIRMNGVRDKERCLTWLGERENYGFFFKNDVEHNILTISNQQGDY